MIFTELILTFLPTLLAFYEPHSAKKHQKWQKENVLKKTGQIIDLYDKTMPDHQKNKDFPGAILQKSIGRS